MKNRIKNRKFDENWFPLVATTLDGMEEILEKELRQIGANDLKRGKRAVYFSGDKDLIYKSNLRLRTALRILKPIHEFPVENEQDLYDGIKAMNWPDIFDVDKTFAINTVVNSEQFNNSQFVALKAKDAIADLFRERTGERPNVELNEPQIRIHIRIYKNTATVSLDSSGESLHKRGYREAGSPAPLNEALAAGLVLLTGYSGFKNFVDPMCGSGTLPIEAAMIANNIAPGLLRDNYAFMNWKDFDKELFQVIHEATVNKIQDKAAKIYGFDRSFRDLDTAKANAKRAGVEDMVIFERQEFFAAEAPGKLGGIVLMNPPYDLRLKVEEVETFYKKIGDKLKTDYTGYKAFVFTANLDAMKHFGLRSFLKAPLKNGQLDARLFGFELYKGTKKVRPEGQKRPRIKREHPVDERKNKRPGGDDGPRPLKL